MTFFFMNFLLINFRYHYSNQENWVQVLVSVNDRGTNVNIYIYMHFTDERTASTRRWLVY